MLAPDKSLYIPAGVLAPSSRKTMDGTLYDALVSMGLRSSARPTISATATLAYTQAGLVPIDATSGNITLTLPASGTNADDVIFDFRRVDNTGNTVTIQRSGSDTIDGGASFTIPGLASYKLQLPAGSSVYRVSNISGATPAAALAAIGGIGSGALRTQGKETIWIPAASLTPNTVGPSATAFETSTNKVLMPSLGYDSTTAEYAQMGLFMPKSWNKGTLTARFIWRGPSSGGVVWQMAGVAISDNDALDAAFGTGQQIADTWLSASNLHVTSETPAMTVGGSPATDDWVALRFGRLPADASDTMAADAQLIGVAVYYTTNAANDA